MMTTVTWQRALTVLMAAIVGLGALVVVLRADGLPATDAAASRATRWFIHQPTGRVVLTDGYGGRALASLDVSSNGDALRVVEGGAGTYVVNDSSGEVRTVDTAGLRLGPAQGLAGLANGGDRVPIVGVGTPGLVVVDTVIGSATLIQPTGESIGFDVNVDQNALVAPDGTIWALAGAQLRRATSNGSASATLDVDPANVDTLSLSLVGNRPFIVDHGGRRALMSTSGRWQNLPTGADGSEVVGQEPGPTAECGWVGANDDLWCVSPSGISDVSTVPGLDIDGADRLAIAGDAAAVIRRLPSSITRFNWRSGVVIDDAPATVSAPADLAVTATTDLVWVDDTGGEFVWAINPWDIQAIHKNNSETLILGEDGNVVDDGTGNGSSASGAGGAPDADLEALSDEREPDRNGIDDPPVAVDDPVTSRAGRTVPVPVTANDYDPDGEAIAVVEVGLAGHGSVEIGSASTVVYTPERGFVGLDRFSYSIADGDGTRASADVIVEILSIDASNQAPIGSDDEAETAAGIPVIIDVLANDIDPDRDPIEIGSSSIAASFGVLTSVKGPSGLAALRYAPSVGFEGLADFAYRPVDSFGAVGEAVNVTVEVARRGDANRPPVVRPDSVRLRRGAETVLGVLANDDDPDGDDLQLSVVAPLPEALRVEVRGAELAITALAGSADPIPFQYMVDDGNGHEVTGGVLVEVISDVEPNRPPLVVADSATTIVGQSVVIDVVANDSDPDNDPLVVVEVSAAAGNKGQAVVLAPNRIQFTPAPLTEDDEATARLTYTVDDGNQHRVSGDITVKVLPETLPDPPFAQDDSTFTFVDEAVTVDVLRNDTDASGERPTLVGTPGCPSGGSAVVTASGLVRYIPPLGQSGTFRCTYEITNSRGLRSAASIIVSVREPAITNLPPTAALDTLVLEVGTTRSIDVTLNDNDPDGPNSGLVVVASSTPSVGTATRQGNTITVVAGVSPGVAAIEYTVRDVDGEVAIGRLSIRITEKANEAPTANPDERIIFGPGGPVSFDVLANDFDPNEPAAGLTLISTVLVSGEGAVVRSGNLVTITPVADVVGEVVASYTIRDSGGLTATGRVTLTVLEPLNRAPVANDDSVEVANGGTVSVPVLFNDSDPDGDALTLAITGGSDQDLGTAELRGSSIVFVARPGRSGAAFVTYSVDDGEFTDTATLTVNVRTCLQSAPVAPSLTFATGYQQPIAIDLASLASNGTVGNVVGPAGFSGGVYTPPAGQNGNVTIEYSVTNECRQVARGVITIDVNQDPIAQPVQATLGRGEIREFPVTSLASDRESLTIDGGSLVPAWVRVETNRVVLSPTVSTATGLATWSVVVRDPGGLTTTVPFSVTIVNDGPTAQADTIDATGGVVNAQITANDVDPDGDNAALVLQSVPATVTFANGERGTITVSGDRRSVTIDPGPGRGEGTFTYTVVDPDGAVSAAATVTVRAQRINNAPVASNQTVDAFVGIESSVVLATTDPEGDPLTITILSDAGGVVAGVSGRTVRVLATSVGSTTFTYRASDGSLESSVATVTVNATTQPNRAPVANNQSVSGVVGVELSFTVNASDADGDPLTVTIVSDPSNVVVGTSGRNVRVVPGAVGTASFTYRVSDGSLVSNVATVTVTAAAPPNNPPVANNQSVSGQVGSQLSFGLNATDADSDSLTATIVSDPVGIVAGVTGLTVRVVPNSSGATTFTYRVSDGKAQSNVATVTVNASAPNRPPVANNQSFERSVGVESVLAMNASDPDGGGLTTIIVSDPGEIVRGTSGLNVTIVPTVVGVATFTFRVSDGTAQSNVATVSVNVTP